MKDNSFDMKKLFFGVTVKNQPNYDLIKDKISKIEYKKIALLYSNQFIDVAKDIEKHTDKEIVFKMQVLGCSNPKFPDSTEAILIIGQGKFHTVSIAYESGLPTFVLEGETIWQVSSDEVEKMAKKERGMLLKYLNSDEIGILITTKPGQLRVEKAVEYHKKLKNKKSYLFVANDINISEFENFGLDCWVNTACPRMDLTDGSIINLDKIPKEVIN